jgi:hypothetical protein
MVVLSSRHPTEVAQFTWKTSNRDHGAKGGFDALFSCNGKFGRQCSGAWYAGTVGEQRRNCIFPMRVPLLLRRLVDYFETDVFLLAAIDDSQLDKIANSGIHHLI